jgi:hypothetical protein
MRYSTTSSSTSFFLQNIRRGTHPVFSAALILSDEAMLATAVTLNGKRVVGVDPERRDLVICT